MITRVNRVCTLLTGAALILVLAAPGCTRRPRSVAWSPPERVEWVDIAHRPIQTASNGYVVLAQLPTRGQFPAAIAVSRLRADENDQSNFDYEGELFISPTPRNEFLSWNRVLDDQMAVSEVFPIWQRDLGGARAEPEQVAAAARALTASLVLVYAMNRPGPNEAEMIGVLFDAQTASPLASIHAQAQSQLEEDEPHISDSAAYWEKDSRAICRREFEQHVRKCIRQLIANDEPELIESPEGWTPAGPIEPVEWPPRFQGFAPKRR